MRRLTDQEVSEPDIILTIPYDRFPPIPKDVWDDLHFYIGKDTGSAYVYKLPAYFARDILDRVLAHNTKE